MKSWHSYLYMHTHVFIHKLMQTQTHMYTNSKLGELCGGRPRMGAFTKNFLCTTLDGLGQQLLPAFLPCSSPCFWNEPYILESLPVDEGGKTSVLRLDLASWPSLLLNAGCLHSVCQYWCSQWCLWRRKSGQLSRKERKRKNRGQERDGEQDWESVSDDGSFNSPRKCVFGLFPKL